MKHKPYHPRTSHGRAIFTVNWFLFSKSLAWDYDRMTLKDIVPIPVFPVKGK